MNIDDAVRVLKEFQPHGFSGFRIDGDRVVAFRPNRAGDYWPGWMAIAIAEKLERDAGRDMPATRKVMALLADAIHRDHLDGTADENAVVYTSSTGENVTEGELRAAIAEWEPRP